MLAPLLSQPQHALPLSLGHRVCPAGKPGWANIFLDKNMPDEEYTDMHAIFHALAEPNRLRIVELLRNGARPVGDIGERLKLRQPQVSKHLKVLKDAGLVDVQALAQQRLYELRAAPLKELNAWTERYRLLWEERFQQMDGVLEDLKKAQRDKEKAHAGSAKGKKRR